MKKCPSCGSRYADDTLSYCLDDGTPLVFASAAETPTVLITETETVIRPEKEVRWDESQVTHVAGLGRSHQRKGNSMRIIMALVAAVLFLALCVLGMAAFLIYRNSAVSVAGNANLNLNTNMRLPATPISNLSLSPTSTPPTTPTVNPTRSPTPPIVLSSYPSSTRLKLARGAYTTSFSGDINPGDKRTMVLACRSGQSLKASVSSTDGCVKIAGDVSSYAITTNAGDNYVSLISSCSTVTRFTVRITII